MLGVDVLIICFRYFWLVSTSVFEPVTPFKEDPVATIGNDNSWLSANTSFIAIHPMLPPSYSLHFIFIELI